MVIVAGLFIEVSVVAHDKVTVASATVVDCVTYPKCYAMDTADERCETLSKNISLATIFK